VVQLIIFPVEVDEFVKIVDEIEKWRNK